MRECCIQIVSLFSKEEMTEQWVLRTDILAQGLYGILPLAITLLRVQRE